MKKFIIPGLLALMLLSSAGLVAQTSSIDRYYDSYSDDDRFTRISVSSKMFSLFANFDMEAPEEQEVVEAISKLKGLKMLVGKEVNDANVLYKKVLNRPAKEMEELMTIEQSDGEIKFFITEEAGKISELLLVAFEGTDVIIMSLVGEIDLKDISKLSQKMDIQGFEHLQNVGEDKK